VKISDIGQKERSKSRVCVQWYSQASVHATYEAASRAFVALEDKMGPVCPSYNVASLQYRKMSAEGSFPDQLAGVMRAPIGRWRAAIS
jgi:hypothetical protein